MFPETLKHGHFTEFLNKPEELDINKYKLLYVISEYSLHIENMLILMSYFMLHFRNVQAWSECYFLFSININIINKNVKHSIKMF